MKSGDHHLVLPTGLYNTLRSLIADFAQIDEFIPSKGTLLDVGSGFGQLADHLAHRHPDLQIIGVEPEPDRVRVASERYRRPNLTFKVGTAEQMSDMPASDAILFFDVLHHIHPDNQIDVLRQYIKILKPSGVLIIKEIDTKPRWKYYFNYAHDFMMTRGDRLRYRSAEEWQSILKQEGLQTEIYRKPTWRPYPHVTIVGRKP